ncbi:MAG: hypothetical protein MJ209_00895 [archaeon]|nr:hypothetical protein [archaeon]
MLKTKISGVIYGKRPVLKAKCANVANIPAESSHEEYSAPVNYNESLMGKELTNFRKIEKENIKMISPLKAFNLHKNELIQDMKRLSSRAEKEDLD